MKNRIKKLFMNLPITLKLFTLCSGLIFFSTFLSVTAVYISTSKVVRENAIRYTNEIMAQSRHYLDEKFNSLLLKTNYLQLNKEFQRIVRSVWYQEAPLSTGDRAVVRDLLNQVKSGDSMIDSIYLCVGDYEFYPYQWGEPYIESFFETELYQEIDNKKQIYWGKESKNSIFPSDHSVIPLVLPVTLYDMQAKKQFLVINLRAEELKNELVDMEKSVEGTLFIFNSEGELVISGTGSGEDAELLKTLLEGRQEIRDYHVSSRTLNINGWVVGCLQSKEVLMRHVNFIRRLMIIIGILSIVIFSFIAMVLSGTITRPVKKLQVLMAEGAGNGFEKQFDVKYKDEIGHLAMVYNEMCVQIRELMEKVREEQELKRKAELRSLNAQINPHFLYNTMDCIYWASLRSGNTEIADVAGNISNIFRLGLNKGHEHTTIANEIRHVTSYLEIQKIIYKGRFDYEIEMDPDVSNCRIIKLLLQPLAENSIIHGFQQMESGGKLWIRAAELNGDILLEVSDNGCGMENEKKKGCIEEDKGSGIGISNMVQRIRLNYGERASFTFIENERAGLTIQIRLPKES